MNLPLHVVLNARSGDGSTEEARAAIEQVLREAQRPYSLLSTETGESVVDLAVRAADAARRDGGALVAAGGDGTLNAGAQAALRHGLPFGVIPQGTFNYFGRTHGVPTGAADATRALLTARRKPVPVGSVNGRLFLVNASLGLYAESLEVRERQTERHGRRPGVAAWAALLTVLRGYTPLRVRLRTDGTAREVRTLSLFVGLNALQLGQMGLDERAPAQGRLAAVVLRPVSRAGLVGLMLQGTLGRLVDARGVDALEASELTVTPVGRRVRAFKVATDGEVDWIEAPLTFRIEPEALTLLAPADPSEPGP